MADLRVEIWQPPGIATFERRISGIDGLMSISGSLYRRQLGRGTLVIPPNYDRLADIIEVDPANHANDVASLVRVYRGSTLMQEWLVSETPNVISEQPVIVAGDDVNAVMDWVIVEPWDWDGSTEFASRFPDWIYGGPNVLVDPTFTSPVCSPRISEFWTDATSGTWTATVDGDTTAGIAFNAGALAVESAYQALSTVNDVLVEGTGEPSTPWRVTFVDPCFPTTYSVSSGTLNGVGLVSTLVQLGAMEPGGWTVSKTLSTGVPITFGNYTNFEVDTPPVPAPSGTNTALHVQATTPVGFSYPGAQTTPSVQPGGLYQGGVWVYSQGTADEVRLVIRPLDEEPLIASSTWPSTSISANTWTFLPATNIQIPETDSRIIFRVASVQNSHAVNLWITDAELNAGLPPANAGEIMDDLLADAQVDHAPARETLTFIKPSYTPSLDSSGAAWPGTLLIDIPRGMTYRKVLESKFGPLGYEWNVRPDLLIPGEWWLDLWAPGTRVTDVTADETPSLLVGQGTLAGYGTKSVPKANRVTAEGAAQYTARVENTASQPAIGVREAYVADISYVATSTDDYAQQTLDKFLDFSLAPRFDIADSDDWPIPILNYGLATRLNVDLADGGGKFSRDVEAFTYQQTDGLVWTIHTGVAQFDQPIFRNVWGGQDQNPPDIVIAPPETNPRPGTPILGGTNRGGVPVSGYAPVQNPLGLMGPTIEGTRWLLDEFSRLRPFEQASALPPSGGGGDPSFLIAASDALEVEKSKADYLCDGEDDDFEIMAAMNQVATNGGVRIVLTSGTFFVRPDMVQLREDVHLHGMGRLSTVIRQMAGSAAGATVTINDPGADAMISQLTISGSGGTTGTVCLDATTSAQLTIEDCWFDFATTAIAFAGRDLLVSQCRSFSVTSFLLVGAASREIRLSNNYIRGVINMGNAVSWQFVDNLTDSTLVGTDARGVVIVGNHWTNVGTIFSDGLIELDQDNTGDAENPGCVIAGNTFDAQYNYAVHAENVVGLNVVGNSSNNGFYLLVDCPAAVVEANTLDDTGDSAATDHAAVLVQGDDCLVVGNNLNWDVSGAGLTDGIGVAGDRNVVQTNKVKPSPHTGFETRYGINVISGNDNIVAGNMLGSPAAYSGDALNDAGTATQLTYPNDATYGDNFTT